MIARRTARQRGACTALKRGAVPSDDLSAQRAFVHKDFGPGAVALAVPDRNEEDGFELMLRGYQISYRHVRSFGHWRWSAAFCLQMRQDLLSGRMSCVTICLNVEL
jgi:hypothetical protein